MQDAAGLPCLLGEVAQVGHHVMAGAALDLGDPREVEAGGGAAQGGDLFFADRQPQLALGLGEGDPQLAPHGECGEAFGVAGLRA